MPGAPAAERTQRAPMRRRARASAVKTMAPARPPAMMACATRASQTSIVRARVIDAAALERHAARRQTATLACVPRAVARRAWPAAARPRVVSTVRPTAPSRMQTAAAQTWRARDATRGAAAWLMPIARAEPAKPAAVAEAHRAIARAARNAFRTTSTAPARLPAERQIVVSFSLAWPSTPALVPSASRRAARMIRVASATTTRSAATVASVCCTSLV